MPSVCAILNFWVSSAESQRPPKGLLPFVIVVIDDTAIIYSNEALPCNGKKKAQV